MAKPARNVPGHSDNALAKKALEAIGQIDKEAKEKKLAQVDALQAAKAAIEGRMNEFRHQITQIDHAIASIKGTPIQKERRDRRNMDDVRVRVGRWMEGRKGQKFAAGDLVREFPELDGTPVSIFLKPLVQEGRLTTDSSDGIRRTKYFVAG